MDLATELRSLHMTPHMSDVWEKKPWPIALGLSYLQYIFSERTPIDSDVAKLASLTHVWTYALAVVFV